MRMRTQRILAALLSLVLLLALAPAGWAENGGETGGETTNTVSINLVPSDKITADDTTFADEMKKANVQAHLYMISPAVKDSMYDTYNYPFEGGDTAFSDLKDKVTEALKADPENMNDRDTMLKKFSPIAQEAAAIVQSGKGTAIGPFDAVDTTITATGLADGMYLLVLHGDLKTDAGEPDYFTTMTKKDSGEDSKEENIIVTRAQSDYYEFLFEPQLIALPTKVDNSTTPPAQQYNTAYGEWTHEMTITAKPDWKPLRGDLKIVKSLTEYIGPDPATFVFHVTAALDGKSVYDDYQAISLTVEQPSSNYIEIKQQIPVGAVVTVVEDYQGSRYEQSGQEIKVSGDETNQTLVIAADKVAEIEFENDHNNTDTGGYGIVNNFTHNKDNTENNGWDHKKIDPNETSVSEVK